MSALRVLLLAILVGALNAALFATGGAAQTTPEEQIVYWPLVTDGTEYRRVAYPEQAGTIVVLAGSEIIIEAKRARVGYWPITREYLADVSRGSPAVEGTLEIVDAAGAVTAVQPERYVMWHPQGVGAGPAELVRGDKAVELHESYVQKARAAVEREKEFQRVVAQHRAAMEAWLRMAGERRENLPPPPPELDLEPPERYHAYASEPTEAPVLSLPEGSYTVRLRGADGKIVPGSERELVSFGPSGEGIGYVLRPGDRWTQPVVSFAPDEAVYTTGRTDLFFQPVPVAEYPAQRFTRLFRPQSVEAGDPALSVWVPRTGAGTQATAAALAVSNGDEVVATVPRTSYRVAQAPGVARGYTIEEFKPQAGSSLAADFEAMRVGWDSGARTVSLVEQGAQGPVARSDREIRLVRVPSEALLFMPAFVPLLVGAAVRLAARRRRAA
jgi:hypothetical protein